MKFQTLVLSTFVIAFVAISAAEGKADKNEKLSTGPREPAQAEQNVVHLGMVERGRFSKFVDPQNGTICYVVSQSRFDGGIAMQCYKKSEQ